MKKLSLLGSSVAVAWCMAACGDPYQAELPTDPQDQVSLYKATMSLPEDEKKIIQEFMNRMNERKLKGGEGVPPGTTVRQALQDQTNWEQTVGAKLKAEQEAALKRLAEAEAKQKREKEEAEKKMLAVATVDLVRKTMQKSEYGEAFEMDLKFTNHSDQELSLIIGMLRISGPGDKLLKEVKIPYRKALKARASATKSGKFPYNPDQERDVALANTPLKELKVTWTPLVYKFADGTRLGTESQDPRLQ